MDTESLGPSATAQGQHPCAHQWLALARVPGSGPGKLLAALGEAGGIGPLMNGSGALWTRLGLPAKTVQGLREPDWRGVDEDLRWAKDPQRHLVCLDDPSYPRLLRDLPDPPLVLFVQGDAEVLNRPQLAIVGSRNPTPGGRETATAFARDLCRRGLTITSGLATGIDAAAHQGALQGGGPTLAVMGTGPDRIYPAANRELAHQIAESGALVTEFPPGTPPRPNHFPRRNRIISGLSLGTLVVEAAPRSGSLITARLAGDQGREVFAIPGSIHNPMARGCHGLIRQGAKLAETAAHILEELGPLYSAQQQPCAQPAAPTESPVDPEYKALLEAMGHDPVSVDRLVERTGLTPEAISSMLLVLELHGTIEPLSGGRYARHH